MSFPDRVFWSAIFFLFGTFITSIFSTLPFGSYIAALLIILASCCLFLFDHKIAAITALFALLGIANIIFHDVLFGGTIIPFDQKREVQGVVLNTKEGAVSQTIIVSLRAPYRGKIEAFLPPLPRYHYGDLMALNGEIKKPDPKRIFRLKKEGIAGTIKFPLIEKIAENKGNKIKSALLGVKQFAKDSYTRVLPPEEAILLSGIVLGDVSGLSKQTSDALRTTGTTHIVALSGYNISIVAQAAIWFFGIFFLLRGRFFAALLTLLIFVVMTGGEASAVRAAIMAGIVFSADQLKKIPSSRNAIAITAALMILYNPYLLVWDIGFILSFLALIGIIYCQPFLRRAMRFNEGVGFLGWKDQFLTTLAAQIAVIPILLSLFGSISVISLLTNIIILVVMPYTMILGMSIVIFSAIAPIVGFALGRVAHFLLFYELWVIRFFSNAGFVFEFAGTGWGFGIVYYAILGYMMIRYRVNAKNEK